MERVETRRLLRLVRACFHKRSRLDLVGAVVYRCDCGMQTRVAVATGVIPLEWMESLDHMDRLDFAELFGVPAPEEIDCMCGSRAKYIYGEFGSVPGELLPKQMPYLRIPSRQAMAELSEAGRFEAQYVDS